MVWESSAAISRSRMKAPMPVLTSSTSAPVPSAIFLLMIDEAISGIASTVPVTSRSAYNFLSAGTSPAWAAQITAPTCSSCCSISALLISARHPGMDSSLSRVPPVWPRPRPGQLGYRGPAGRDQRRQRQGDLVPDAAGGVLVDRRPRQARRSPSGRRSRSSPRSSGAARCRSDRGRTPPWPSPTSARRRSSPLAMAWMSQLDLVVGELVAVPFGDDQFDDVVRRPAVSLPMRASIPHGRRAAVGRGGHR